MKIAMILEQIDLGTLALPEFQRGYVWNRDQVRGLMDSLYRRHPVGGLLVWETRTDSAPIRGDGAPAPGGTVDLLLDGQQRITMLYGIMRGRPPKFFQGDAKAFTGLAFNLDTETFEFTGVKMKNDPLWIDVTSLMKSDVGDFIARIFADPELAPKAPIYINRLTRLQGIKEVDFYADKVAGEDKTVDVVVDIFNRVNSGGTKLSKGDLALAKVCAGWPEARDAMNARLKKWEEKGFRFRLDWFLRCVNSVITGDSYFSALADVDAQAFAKGVVDAEKRVDALLNLISSRLGLDHDDVLASRFALPLLARYLQQRGGALPSQRERDRLLYWYIHSLLWGRYAGSTETVLARDLSLIKNPEGALDRLVDDIRRQRGDLKVRPDDFHGWSRGARFYPFLYMLTRVEHARDWGNGIELRDNLLGSLNALQLHHIFPKALLYKHGYARPDVNALANLTFLTQETNLKISDRDPADYLPEIEARNPGVLASHWLPTDPGLWNVARYPDFLAARRDLLAKAANAFLNGLSAGLVEDEEVATPALERTGPMPSGTIAGDDERQILVDVNDWVAAQGLPRGELSYELASPETGEPLAFLDLAWPNGLQEGLSASAAVLLDEPEEVEEAANRAGFVYFTNVGAFKYYVRSEILALDVAFV